ncbi:hypothetical protein PIB30_080648 [Stylosanthes scabra]|uniref:Uncharacterized protein n=1 Tax=Stylosanthes scabra TaxID=79078 RepID=A0ABU6TR06_9FABA|nr:hypothetical protein [Stylosanthes scabra]
MSMNHAQHEGEWVQVNRRGKKKMSQGQKMGLSLKKSDPIKFQPKANPLTSKVSHGSKNETKFSPSSSGVKVTPELAASEKKSQPATPIGANSIVSRYKRRRPVSLQNSPIEARTTNSNFVSTSNDPPIINDDRNKSGDGNHEL